MREVAAMWGSTRMVVLAAISAALYGASLIAFKPLTILPGVVEVRPGVALVVLCSVLFGPAGAWGAAIGNTIGDLAGGLGVGTAVGFVANFLLGLLPYKLLRAFGVDDPVDGGARAGAALALGCVAGSVACAAAVGAGIQGLGLWRSAYAVLFPLIAFPNMLITLALSPFLLRAIHPRVRALGLTWEDVLDARAAPRTAARRALGAIAAAAILAELALYLAAQAGAVDLAFPEGARFDARIVLVVGAPLLVGVAAAVLADARALPRSPAR